MNEEVENNQSDWQPIRLTDGERAFLAESTATLESKVERIIGLRLSGKEAWLDPMTAPREPWRVISEDRDKPTLAKVTIQYGDTEPEVVLGHWWRSVDKGYAHRTGDNAVRALQTVTSVELLDVHNPATHVPVERTLIEKATRLKQSGVLRLLRKQHFQATADLIYDLAALADGAQS